MKIGVISDIHGNLKALEAILDHAKNENCDHLYFLGDMIGIGPYPRETIELILSLPHAKYVLGNHEEYFIKGAINYEMAEGELLHQQWIATMLTDDIKQKLESLLYVITETIGGVRVVFMHYALNDKVGKTFKPIEKNITRHALDTLFEGVEADLIFYGHEHHPSNVLGEKQYINVGSSGCTTSNKTHYTTVTFNNDQCEIQTHQIPYDKDKVLTELTKRNVPEKEFIANIFFGSTGCVNNFV